MNAPLDHPRAAWLLLVPLLFVAFFLELGTAPLFDVDEGAFSAATWEMLQRGDFVTTYLNGEPRFDKPILIYWLQAVAVSVFGVHEWSFRLPSALAASLWVIVVQRFAAWRLDPVTACYAAAITATTLTVVVIGRAATADALLNLFLVLAMLDVFRHAEQPGRGVLLRVYLWMGLGALTKGPVAVVIPFLTSLIYFASLGRLTDWRRAVVDGRGWVLFVLIVVPWYVLEYLDQGQAFIDGFLLKHNVSRFTETMEGHGGTPFYYLLAIVPVLTPYGGAFLALLPGLRRLWADPLDRWLTLWFAVVLVIFSLSSTQLPHYVLYGCTPLFILMARHRTVLRSRTLAFLPPMIFILICLGLPHLGSVADMVVSAGLVDKLPAEHERAAMARAEQETGLLFNLAGLALLVTVVILWVRRNTPVFPVLVGVGVLQTLYLVVIVTPMIGATLQEPVKRAGLLASTRTERVVTWKIDAPSFTVYRGQVTTGEYPKPGELVLTRLGKADSLGELDVLLDSGGVLLARVPHRATD